MDTKRFHSPQYKRQIHANRTHKRAALPRPQTKLQSVLYSLGLGSRGRKIKAFLILAVLVYLIYFATFFFIDSPKVSGADSEQSAEVSKHLQEYSRAYRYGLPQKHILFFDKDSFVKYLLAQDLQISSVEKIKKRPLNKLFIEVVQRVPVYTLLNKGNYYILNSDGNISYQTSEQQAAAFPLIINTAEEEVAEGERILAEQKKSFINYLSSNFEKKMSSAVQRFEMPGKASDQVTVISTKGFKVYFDSKKDPAVSLGQLFAVWVALVPEQQNRLDYIDLRFDQGAYGCYRGDPCSGN